MPIYFDLYLMQDTVEHLKLVTKTTDLHTVVCDYKTICLNKQKNGQTNET
jgi:hypothetical protein